MPYVRSKEDAEFVARAARKALGFKVISFESEGEWLVEASESLGIRLWAEGNSKLVNFIAGMYAERDRAEKAKQS